jgi:hypothetical protein
MPRPLLWVLMCEDRRFHPTEAIVQDDQEETYRVDLVLVVKEKHNIDCPTLMFWVLVNV